MVPLSGVVVRVTDILSHTKLSQLSNGSSSLTINILGVVSPKSISLLIYGLDCGYKKNSKT